jgi:hypothetical protein
VAGTPDQLPFLTGEQDKSPRKEFFYFNDDGHLVAVRALDWKSVFCEQRTEGTLAVWRDPFVCMRGPTLSALRREDEGRLGLLPGARLYSTFLKPCAGGISGKTSGNRGPVAQTPFALTVLVGVARAILRAAERLTLGTTRRQDAPLVELSGDSTPHPVSPVRIVANLHVIGAVQWQTFRMTRPVQLRRSLLVSL